jgi:hypothetical protein
MEQKQKCVVMELDVYGKFVYDNKLTTKTKNYNRNFSRNKNFKIKCKKQQSGNCKGRYGRTNI